MRKRKEYVKWDGNQLTLHLEYRDVLVQTLTPYVDKLRDEYLKQGWQILSAEASVEALIDDVILVQCDEGWLAYSLSLPWFSPEKLVCEEFIAGVSLTTAVEILTAVAKEEDAHRIVVGTRASPNGRHFGLAKRYEQAGLSVSTIELTMEIPNEQGS